MQFPRHEQIDQVPHIQWKWVASYSLSGPTPFSVQYFSSGYHVKGPRNLPAQSKETMCGSWSCSDPFLWLLVFRWPFLVAIIPQSFFTIQRFWHCLGLLETAALLYCAVTIDWDCLNKLFWYILVWFSFCLAISWIWCPRKSQLSSNCNKQISTSAYYSQGGLRRSADQPTIIMHAFKQL